MILGWLPLQVNANEQSTCGANCDKIRRLTEFAVQKAAALIVTVAKEDHNPNNITRDHGGIDPSETIRRHISWKVVNLRTQLSLNLSFVDLPMTW
jgi:hypothetical protein